MDPHQVRKEITTKLAVPLWPHAGKALNLGRSETYAAAKVGKIPVIRVGQRKLNVATSWLREVLGLETH